MTTKEKWLAEIQHHKENNLLPNGGIIPNLDKDSIAKLKDSMNQKKYIIDDSYYDFLENSNGLDYHGIMIFADHEYTFYRDCVIFGVIDQNNQMREYNEETCVFFGVMGDEFLTFTLDKKWALVDGGSRTVFDKYDDFDTLIWETMKILNSDLS